MLEEYCLWHHAAFLRRRRAHEEAPVLIEVPRADVPSEDPPRPDEPAIAAMPVELLAHVPTDGAPT